MIPLLKDLEGSRDVIETGLGGIVDGRFLFCGFDVNGEIGGRMTQTEVLLLWLLGRKPQPPETRIMDALITINAYPDIRIWCVRAGAFAAAAGTPISGAYAAANAAYNAGIFGVRAALSFRRFITDFAPRASQGDLESLIEGMIASKAFFPGFGRPLIQGPDERVERFKTFFAEWRHPPGPYTRLLFGIAEILTRRKGLHPNYASLIVAVLLDPPFALDDSKITAALHFIAHLAHIAPICEIAGRESGKPLLPARIDDIDYRGVAPRRIQNARSRD